MSAPRRASGNPTRSSAGVVEFLTITLTGFWSVNSSIVSMYRRL